MSTTSVEASLDIPFNRFLRIEHIELPKEQAELLFKRFQYRALFLFRQLPEFLFKRPKGFLTRFVEELFFGPSCLPLVLTVMFDPQVDVLSRVCWQLVIDDVLKASSQVNFQSFMPGKLIENVNPTGCATR